MSIVLIYDRYGFDAWVNYSSYGNVYGVSTTASQGSTGGDFGYVICEGCGGFVSGYTVKYYENGKLERLEVVGYYENLVYKINQAPVPEYRVLYNSLTTTVFGQRISVETEVGTVERKTVVIVDFNSSGKRITDVRGFSVVTRTTKTGKTSEWKSLDRDAQNKLQIPIGLSEFIQMVVNLGDNKTVWDKYWEFVLEVNEPTKTTIKYGTNTHR